MAGRRAGCLAERRRQQPESPRRPAAGRPAAGLVTGYQLGDDLPGYHQPFQLAPGVVELLAQQLDLARPPGR
jgi:hypothetical protein